MSNDSMKKATATSHGRRRFEAVKALDEESGLLVFKILGSASVEQELNRKDWPCMGASEITKPKFILKG